MYFFVKLQIHFLSAICFLLDRHIQYCRKIYCELETQEESRSTSVNFELKPAIFLVAVQQPCNVLQAWQVSRLPLFFSTFKVCQVIETFLLDKNILLSYQYWGF